MRKTSWLGLLTTVIVGLGSSLQPDLRAQEGLAFSTSNDVSVPGFDGGDKDLLGHVVGSPAFPFLTSQGMAFLLGDADADGLHDDLTDIDAMSIQSSEFPGAYGMIVSFISDGAGIEDGDLVRFVAGGGPDGGGFETVFREDDLVAAIGAVDGNIDVDAAFVDPIDGSLIFSVAEDEDSSLISGATPGTVRDDEILYLAAGQSLASVLFDGDEVSQAVAHALGVDPFDVKDVLSVTKGPAGDVWFSIQSPSDQDATVFSMAGDGSIVSGQSESDFGFTNSVELDAIAYLPDMPRFGVLRSEPERPTPNDPTAFLMWRGTSGAAFQALLSVAVGDPGQYPLPGFAGLYLDPSDPLFAVSLRAAPFFSGHFDANGQARLDLPAPPDAIPLDIAVQILDVEAFSISHPIWVEVNQ